MSEYIEDRIESEFSRYPKEPGTGKWSNQKEVQRAAIAHGPFSDSTFICGTTLPQPVYTFDSAEKVRWWGISPF